MAKEVKAKKPVKEAEGKTYHLSKRAEDGKWQVKYAGGKIAIKLFDTKEEALEYTKKMAKNQNRAILVHASRGNSNGKLRKS
jgi:gamma-glutamyl phosphate reductase